MKLNYTIEIFRERLKKAIYESSINSRTQEEVINKIAERGYELGFISGIFEGNVALDSLSLMDIGVFALIIFNITDIGYINPSVYLEDIELERVQHYKIDDTQDLFEYPVVFEHARQIAPDIWTVAVPIQFISKLGRSNMLNYEFDTQREAKTIETDKGIILTPTVNSQSVVEIKNEIVEGNLIPTILTFNIPLIESENFKYDKKLNRWILLKGKLNIIDGYHRYLGIIAAIREREKIEFNFEIRLTNFDNDKARKFIVQEDKRNPISKEYIKSIDDADLSTQLINRLNQNNQSELKGKITTDNTTITSGLSLVSFEIMHKTIEKLWKLVTIDDAEVLFDYLRVFFNRLVGLYPDELKTQIQRYKKVNNISDERMFVIYLILAKQLENNENWRIELENIMNKIGEETELFNEYLDIPASLIKQRFNRYFKIVNDIVEVLINVRQII